MTATPELTVDEARLELSRLEARVNELRLFLRQRTPAGLTRLEWLAAVEFVRAGSTQLAAARLGMWPGDYRARLTSARRKLGVDDAVGLAPALGLMDGVL